MVGKIAPALAVGCTVVMKPAPQDPLAIIVLAEIMHEVGFPPGVVNLVTSVAPDAVGGADVETATSTWCRSPAPPRSAQTHLRGRRATR